MKTSFYVGCSTNNDLAYSVGLIVQGNYKFDIELFDANFALTKLAQCTSLDAAMAAARLLISSFNKDAENKLRESYIKYEKLNS